MASRCQCGSEKLQAVPDLGCLDCGAACCPACAIHLESAVYCRGCAGTLLGAGPIRAGGPYGLQ
jgi:hypothetical protein